MLDFIALAQQCAPAVAPATMAALVRTESNFDPLAIGINGGPRLRRQPRDQAEAVATAKSLMQRGYDIDVGLGQVNVANLARAGLRIDDAFDPCKNLAAAAMILHGNYLAAKVRVSGEQAALRAALSAYNTGSLSKGWANGYVQRVLHNAAGEVPVINAGALLPVLPVRHQPATLQTRSVPRVPSADSLPVMLTVQGQGDHSPQEAGANVYARAPQDIMVYAGTRK